MKAKLILTCVMAVILLSLCACSPATEQASTDILYAWHQETEIAVGDSLTVTLESNATTGFQWELAEISDQTVLAEVGHEYQAPEAGAAVGAGGQEVWTFKALKKGKSTISMQYLRPWEEDVEPAQTFALTVVVK